MANVLKLAAVKTQDVTYCMTGRSDWFVVQCCRCGVRAAPLERHLRS